jgi:hypothetical protein
MNDIFDKLIIVLVLQAKFKNSRILEFSLRIFAGALNVIFS